MKNFIEVKLKRRSLKIQQSFRYIVVYLNSILKGYSHTGENPPVVRVCTYLSFLKQF